MTTKFGTDGWRAVISDTFTFANLRLVAQAITDYVLEEAGDDQTEVIVGFRHALSVRPLRNRAGAARLR